MVEIAVRSGGRRRRFAQARPGPASQSSRGRRRGWRGNLAVIEFAPHGLRTAGNWKVDWKVLPCWCGARPVSVEALRGGAMHLTVDLLRTADGRLEGTVITETGREQASPARWTCCGSSRSSSRRGRAPVGAAMTTAQRERRRGSPRRSGSSSRSCCRRAGAVQRAARLGAPDSAYSAFYARAATSSSRPSPCTSCRLPASRSCGTWSRCATSSTRSTGAVGDGARAQPAGGVMFVALLFAGTAAVGAGRVRRLLRPHARRGSGDGAGAHGLGYGLVFMFAVRGAGMFALTTTTLLRNAKVLPTIPAVLAYVLAAFLLLTVTDNPAACSSCRPGWSSSRSFCCATPPPLDRSLTALPAPPIPTP